MKIIQIAILTIFCSSYICAENSKNIYVEEFNTFKNSPDYQLIFNEDSNIMLRIIERDIENCKNLSWLQRVMRSSFLNLGTIVVTEKTMPQLYSYINAICEQSGIKMPTIFLTTEKGFFNAAAQKLLMSTGAIVIGQKLLLETSAQELEAVVAHEIGHIAYNHINKTLAVFFSTAIVAGLITNYIDKNAPINPTIKSFLPALIASYATPLIVNKRFEKEADEFAYKVMNKGEGLIELFEHFQHKAASADNDFNHTSDMLTNNKSELSLYSYAGLSSSYYLAKLGHNIDKAYMWLYYNTPFGAHPSPEARIKATQDYLDSQAIIAPTA